MAINQTFIDFVTPVPADWLNNVNGFVNAGNALSLIVTNITALRAVLKTQHTGVFVSGYYAQGDGGGGQYWFDSTDTISADNGGTIIVATDGGRWKLQLINPLSVRQFGAKGDGVTDDSAAIQASINWMTSGGKLFFPIGTYKINTTLTVPPISGANSNLFLQGIGNDSVIQPGASITSLFNITGKNTTVKDFFFNNVSSFATNAILFTTSSSDAAYSGRIENNTIIGFTNGISASGQNYDINDNFVQNNTTHILFTNDGRNTSISDNYFLGGNIGIRLSTTGTQAEGTRIINNTVLVTGTSGAGIQIDAALDITIMSNIIDQTGPSSPGIFMASGANQINKIKIIGNWIAAGQNSYSIFASGTTNDFSIIGNSIMSNNSLVATAGISLNATNGVKIISNTFGIVTGPDLSFSSVVNQTILGNTSSQGGSNALANLFSQPTTSSQQLTTLSVQMPTAGGVTIETGSGAPTASRNQGSLYLRNDGGVGGHLYICNGGTTWNVVAGA